MDYVRPFFKNKFVDNVLALLLCEINVLDMVNMVNFY